MWEKLREVRQILGEISPENRMKLHDALFAVSQEGAEISDLLEILEEDCGEYQGSWINEYFNSPSRKEFNERLKTA